MVEPFRFVTGGTLAADSPSYIRRPADAELLNACLSGQFAYVLSSRQMGKSSLVVHTLAALHDQGVQAVLIDLTRIGTDHPQAESWYLGLLAELEAAFQPRTDLFDWWAARAPLAPVQRFIDYIGTVLPEEAGTPLVIFIDEIDTTLRLPFSDDFYAAIRHLHNARAGHPELRRLSFVLSGVATPTELMHDALRTPFNIGQRIELADFSADEVRPLISRTGAPLDELDAALQRLLHWTGGQPYLTQKLCALLAAPVGPSQVAALAAERIDRLVATQLLSETGQADPHFQSIGNALINAAPDLKDTLFETWAQVSAGRRVACLDNSPVHNRLRLSGLVRRHNGWLEPRNQLYLQIYGPAWIRRHRPTFWTPANRLWAAAVGLSLSACVVLMVLWQRAEQATEAARRATEEARASATRAQAATLAAQALTARSDGDPDGALGNAWQALQQHVSPQTQRAAFDVAEHHQSVARLVGHSGPVNAVTVSTDGRRTATASDDGTIRLWQLPDGQPAATLKGHAGPVHGLGFSADGSRLLSIGADRSVRLWSADGRPGGVLTHPEPVMSAIFSPDGALIASAAQDGLVRLWRATDGVLLHELAAHRHWARTLAFSPDGHLLACGGNDGQLLLWALRDGIRRTATLPAHTDWLRSLAFSPDGRQLISTGDDRRVRLWSISASGEAQLRHTFPMPTGAARSAVFSPDGQRIAAAGGGNEGSVMVWEARSRRRLAQWRPPLGWLGGALFAGSSDEILVYGERHHALLYRLGQEAPVLSLIGHTGALRDLTLPAGAPMPTSTVLSASADGTARVWSLSPASRLTLLRPGQQPVNEVAWSHDGRALLVAGSDGVALLHHVGTQAPPTVLQHTRAVITSVALSSDGRYAATATKQRSGASEPTVTLHDLQNGRTLPLAQTDAEASHMVTFSPDSRWLLAAGQNGTATVWDTHSPTHAIALSRHDGPIESAVFSPDGRTILTAGSDGTARLWSWPDPHTVILLQHSDTSERRVRMASFSPDGSRVATVGDNRLVRVWRRDSGELLWSRDHHQAPVMSAVFNCDGRLLVSASHDRTARVWDASSGTELRTLTAAGPAQEVLSAGFSPRGDLIATSSSDGHARLWLTRDGRQVADFVHDQWIWHLAFDPGGRWLATASKDGSAAIWDLQRSDAQVLDAWITQRLRWLHADLPASAAVDSGAAITAPPAASAAAIPPPCGR